MLIRMPCATAASAVMPVVARKRPYLGRLWSKSIIQKTSELKIAGPRRLRGSSLTNFETKYAESLYELDACSFTITAFSAGKTLMTAWTFPVVL